MDKNAEYKNLKKKLDKLLKNWEEALKKKFGKDFTFVEDGALPGYPHQKLKILYIGRESHDNNPKELMRSISNGTYTDELKGTQTFRRAVLFAYGLINKKTWGKVKKWKENGGVKEWKDNIKTPEKPNKELSFAFMNVSKFDNRSGKELGEKFYECTYESLEKGFTHREIDNILNPDLIISWNLKRRLEEDFFKELTGSEKPIKTLLRYDRSKKPKSTNIWIYKQKIPLIDASCHFSCRGSNKKLFYEPIWKAVNSKMVKDLIAKKKLGDLFEDWEKALKKKFGKDFKFVEDGALPGYLSQDPKILFIGRESYDCKGDDLMWGIQHGFFKEDGSEDSNNLFNCAWKVAHGLLNGIEKWDDIPEIEKIRRKGTSTSFAFMDVSKFAHLDGKGSQLSPHFVGYVYESLGENKSGRNFIREEIDLLNPDLIISWNLIQCRGLGKTFLKKLTGSDSCEERSNVHIWVYKSKIPLLDTWHFSAVTKRHKKDAETDIYNPIMKAVNSKAVKDLIAKKKAQDKAELR